MIDLSISIVLYENDEEEIQSLLNCIYANSLLYKVYLIDNSATDKLKTLVNKNDVEYIFNNKNIGFGKAHNIALKKSINDSLYHLVLNPDIEFETDVLEKIFDFMQAHKDVGQLLPKVFYRNGDLQKLCHLLPRPANLISRRFFENTSWAKKINDKYELNGFAYNKSLNIPNLSGCFMFLRCDVLKQTGLFDERFFMYLEDVDLCRRIHAISRTVFLPDVSIIHGFEKESYTNKIVLKHHINSAIKYFNKWGWFIDKERKKFNHRILKDISVQKSNSAQNSFKPRLLILTNRLVVGGISNDIIPLAYYLRSEFEIFILYGEKEEGEAEAIFLLNKYPGLNIKKIPSFQKQIHPLKDTMAWFGISKEIKNFNADIVHTHGAKSGFLGRLAAYKNKVPYIIHTYHGHHFHSYYNRFISGFLLKMEKRLGRITTVIIAISKWQKKELTEIYNIVPPEKVRTISLGIEVEKKNLDPVKQRCVFRKKYAVEEDIIAIGIAGRIVPIKNLQLFVQVAANLLSSTTKKICFFIMGDGILKKQIEAQCTSLNISYTENAGEKADMIFTSWIEDIVPAIHAMDIIALTSNNEGTPVSLIEAQFCGKPVVATNAGGVKDIVLNNETGFVAEPGDADAIFKKLKLLIENNELRKTMGEKAARFAAANFSKQKEVESYKQLYKNLLTLKKTERSTHQQAVTE
jgi:glycosyltransferase involved in cell wall biosynthesis